MTESCRCHKTVGKWKKKMYSWHFQIISLFCKKKRIGSLRVRKLINWLLESRAGSSTAHGIRQFSHVLTNSSTWCVLYSKPTNYGLLVYVCIHVLHIFASKLHLLHFTCIHPNSMHCLYMPVCFSLYGKVGVPLVLFKVLAWPSSLPWP